MKRYFIVMYTYNSYNSKNGNGQMTVETNDNSYLNLKQTLEDITNLIKEKYNFLKFTPIITNIIELNKEDFNNWCLNYENYENKKENKEKDWDEIIKNMLFDINYHPIYFITSTQGKGNSLNNYNPFLYFNLHDKTQKDNHGYYYQIASLRTLEELKEILKKKYNNE